jgi:ferritin
MKMTPAVQDAINSQINIEFQSAYSYLAMSAYCESIMFPGCANWLRMQAEEEQGHAMKLYHFMRERSARIIFQPVPGPPMDYKNIVDVFEQSLKNEERVSESINNLYELAFKEKSFATAAELQWFLTEQVEEEQTARMILAKFQRVKDDPAALLDLDEDLGSRSSGAK